MKRPLFIVAVIVLSGIICGIKEVGFVEKTAAIIIVAAIMSMIKSGMSQEDDPLLFFRHKYGLNKKITYPMLLAGISISLFFLGYCRAAYISDHYHSEACQEFYEYFEPGNPAQFNYALYLKSQGICSREQYERYKNREAGESPLLQHLYRLRDYCSYLLETEVEEHDAGIYKAVVLGQKGDMDSEVRDIYQDAGIAHLLAVSGLHLSLIGGSMYQFVRRKLKKRDAAIIVSVIMFLYMLLTGASGSAVRAVVMLMLSFIAAANNRIYDMRTALSVSAIVLMLWRPYQIFTSGFQLSFGAVAAITLVGENIIHQTELLLENAGEKRIVRKRVCRRNRLPSFGKMLIVSISIQIFTLPVMAYHYFKFPVYGILLNLIVIPLMAAVLCSGIALIVLGLMLSGSAAIGWNAVRYARLPIALAAGPGHYILQLYEFLARSSMKIPGASLLIGQPDKWQILLYYILLYLLLNAFSHKMIRRKREIGGRLLLLLAAVLMMPFLLHHVERKSFCVYALDVGQGDAFVIKNKSSWMLIDGGSSTRKTMGKDILEPFLMSKGVKRLEQLVLSHSDADHVNGAEYLLKESNILIETLILPEPAQDNANYDALRELWSERGKIIYPSASAMLPLADEPIFRCVYSGCSAEDTNRNSLVLLLQKDEFSMLFTGDTTAEDEEVFSMILKDWRAANQRNVCVLKAAHHGSRSANTAACLDALQPDYAIISCGKNNRYGHPHPEVVEALYSRDIRILQTPELGEIEFYKDYSGRFFMQSFKRL